MSNEKTTITPGNCRVDLSDSKCDQMIDFTGVKLDKNKDLVTLYDGAMPIQSLFFNKLKDAGGSPFATAEALYTAIRSACT